MRVWSMLFIWGAGLALSPSASASTCPEWLLGLGRALQGEAQKAWKILRMDREFHIERFQTHFPAIRQSHQGTWLARRSLLPENEAGLTTEQALALLSTLRGQKFDLPRDSKQVYARPYTISDGSLSASALVKESHTRLKIDASTATEQVTVGNGSRSAIHDARWEVMAFQLDRFFGMNLVPPSIMINRDQSAQLIIPSREANYSKALRDPSHLLDLSMIRMLDALLSNADRDFPGNFRITRSQRALAVDFDLSAPTPAVPAAIHRRLLIRNFPIESGMLGKGHLPGVYSRSVLARMEALTPEDLFQMAESGGIQLTDSEARAIYSGVRTVLATVQELAQVYGEGQVLVP